jgi:Helix-turn-helix domain
MSKPTLIPSAMFDSIAIQVPVMTQERFAEKAGVSKATIRGMVETKQLPSKKIGKRRFINIAALTSDCLKEAGLTLTPEETQEQ